MTIRYGRSNPARGGRKIEELILDRHTTVMKPDGICEETHRKVWLDIGTLRDTVTNHIPEQPKSLAEKLLIARGE